MTWRGVARENLDAANVLYGQGQWRSAASRAYYAVFAAVTHRLPRTAFAPRRTAPKHRDLQALADAHFTWLQWHQRAAVKSAIKRTYALRLAADYRPADNVDRVAAKQAINNAGGVLRRLGV